jgi:hypothetical protein
MPALCEHFIKTFMPCNEHSKYTRKIHGGLYMLSKAQGHGHIACEMKLSASPILGMPLPTGFTWQKKNQPTNESEWIYFFLKPTVKSEYHWSCLLTPACEQRKYYAF